MVINTENKASLKICLHSEKGGGGGDEFGKNPNSHFLNFNSSLSRSLPMQRYRERRKVFASLIVTDMAGYVHVHVHATWVLPPERE